MFKQLTQNGPIAVNPMQLDQNGWTAVSSAASASAGVRNLFVAGNEVTDVKIGSTDVNEIYVGSTLVWSRS